MNDRSTSRWQQTVATANREFGSAYDVVSRSVRLFEWCEFQLLGFVGSPNDIVEGLKIQQANYSWRDDSVQDAVRVLTFSAQILGFDDKLPANGDVTQATELLDRMVKLGEPFFSLVGRTLTELHARGPYYNDCPRVVKFGDCSLDHLVRISAFLERIGFSLQYTSALLGEAQQDRTLVVLHTEPLLLIKPLDPESLLRKARWL
ncbi:MAG: hypothetical protein EKK48_13970 [Candidatus Melainabacteria bacterium]|nr:MAG: hypothetical protein EKK48_13970 [Candidatus Melainabacteria bacterium]